MFHLKIILLITIASQASQVQGSWPWVDYFLGGDCERFINANEKFWSEERHNLARIITENYKGDIKMAENIFNCVSSMIWGTNYEVYEDFMTGYLALYRVLCLEQQEVTNLALRTAIRMHEVAKRAETTFRDSELHILHTYVEEFKNVMLPTFKSVNFDQWVHIIHPYQSLYLAMYDGKVDMWPIDAPLTENSFKWYVNRTFYTDQSDAYTLQVFFTNVENGYLLASDHLGYVVGTNDPNSGYHLWTVKLQNLKDDDVGTICLKNKITGKYLKSDEYRVDMVDDQKYHVLPMTTHTENRIYLILKSE